MEFVKRRLCSKRRATTVLYGSIRRSVAERRMWRLITVSDSAVVDRVNVRVHSARYVRHWVREAVAKTGLQWRTA